MARTKQVTSDFGGTCHLFTRIFSQFGWAAFFFHRSTNSISDYSPTEDYEQRTLQRAVADPEYAKSIHAIAMRIYLQSIGPVDLQLAVCRLLAELAEVTQSLSPSRS